MIEDRAYDEATDRINELERAIRDYLSNYKFNKSQGIWVQNMGSTEQDVHECLTELNRLVPQ
jgi:hypothetical protein